MDLQSVVQFKREVDGRLYTFTMPNDAPLGEAYDVLFDGLKSIVKIANTNVEKMVRKADEKDAKSEVVDGNSK